MSGLAWTVVGLGGGFLLIALGDLVSEEIRGWLDLAPHAILRLAATRLAPEARSDIYQEDWLPELTYALRGAESRPITRLIRATRFALGLLISARKIEIRAPAIHTKAGGAAAAGAGTGAVPVMGKTFVFVEGETDRDAVSQLLRRRGSRVPPVVVLGGDPKQLPPLPGIWTMQAGNDDG